MYFLLCVMIAETNVQPKRFIDRKYIIEYAATLGEDGNSASNSGTPKNEQFESVVATVVMR